VLTAKDRKYCFLNLFPYAKKECTFTGSFTTDVTDPKSV
jgi:hypothetical protein